MSIAMLSIFSLACIYGIVLGVFLNKISWKVVDYKREQRRKAAEGKGDGEPEEGKGDGKAAEGKGDGEPEEGKGERGRQADEGKGERGRQADEGKGDGEAAEGKGDGEQKDAQKEGKRSKELSLHCADDRSRKLARILLPILHPLLCGIGGGILALNETIPLVIRVTLAIVFCLFVSIALISSWVDILIRIIPNEIVLTIAALGIVFRIVCAIADPWSLLGGFASFALTFGMFSLAMFIGRKRWNSRGVGAGDFKLAMIASFIVGFPGIAYFYIALCITILVYFTYMIAKRSFGFFVWFPMCSFLMIALLVGLIYSYIPGAPLLF